MRRRDLFRGLAALAALGPLAVRRMPEPEAEDMWARLRLTQFSAPVIQTSGNGQHWVEGYGRAFKPHGTASFRPYAGPSIEFMLIEERDA